MIKKLILLLKSWDEDAMDAMCKDCAAFRNCCDCPLHENNKDKLLDELEKKST